LAKGEKEKPPIGNADGNAKSFKENKKILRMKNEPEDARHHQDNEDWRKVKDSSIWQTVNEIYETYH
jgi:hypothetical protein